MSIAIAVVLQPSKIVRCCVMSFSLFLVMIGIYIGSLENYSYLIRCILTGICGLASWLSFLYNKKIAKTRWRLSIDGKGQLRCQPDSSLRAESFLSSQEINYLNLVTGTTLWPHALFLRLENREDNVMLNLVVLPDVLTKDEFRRLSVACRWIMARA